MSAMPAFSRHFFDLSIREGLPLALGSYGFLHHVLKFEIGLDTLRFFFGELLRGAVCAAVSYDVVILSRERQAPWPLTPDS
jgi:hypothetical protein